MADKTCRGSDGKTPFRRGYLFKSRRVDIWVVEVGFLTRHGHDADGMKRELRSCEAEALARIFEPLVHKRSLLKLLARRVRTGKMKSEEAHDSWFSFFQRINDSKSAAYPRLHGEQHIAAQQDYAETADALEGAAVLEFERRPPHPLPLRDAFLVAATPSAATSQSSSDFAAPRAITASRR